MTDEVESRSPAKGVMELVERISAERYQEPTDWDYGAQDACTLILRELRKLPTISPPTQDERLELLDVRLLRSEEFGQVANAEVERRGDEIERLRKALEPFLPAYDAYVAVMQNFTVTGGTSAERRFSEGEREATASEAAYEALTSITFDQLHAVHEALAATPASDKPEGEALIGLREAATDLLTKRDEFDAAGELHLIGYRIDLWNCLREILSSLPADNRGGGE